MNEQFEETPKDSMFFNVETETTANVRSLRKVEESL